MMLFRLLPLISAFYIYHRNTKKYLGAKKLPSSSFKQLVPVDKSEAIDFRIKQGKVYTDKTLNSRTTKIQDTPMNVNLRFVTKNGQLSWINESGIDRDKNNLILYDSYSSNPLPTQFFMNFLSDGSYSFGSQSKCFIYNELGRNFITGSCNNIRGSTFDIISEK